MDKNAIKKFAVWARRELIARVSQKAAEFGIEEQEIIPGSADSVRERVLTADQKKQRQALIAQIEDKGYEEVMEEVAYTWFNRFSALRFMEVNGYLPSRVRVFTNEENNFKPQIIDEAIHLELEGLDMEKVYALKDANDTEELYKYLLITQCNALSPILPGMFQKISDYTELLFPDNLLREGSVIYQMITLIPEEDWKDAVQIIGWLYQYYNSEKKDEVFAALKKNVKITKNNIPAATQLFTPDWIVRYMVENSLGRLWVEGHPDTADSLIPTAEEQKRYADGERDPEDTKWHYYLEEAQQEPEVQAQLAEIRKDYAAMSPEDIKAIDPCCGSGHILAYMFDVLMQIYASYGYTSREAVASILRNNLYGLDIDDRAAQLAYFAVMMKARQYDRRFFSHTEQPHVYAIRESNHLNGDVVEYFCNGDPELSKAIATIREELYDAKEYGSILTVSQQDWNAIYNRFDEVHDDISMYKDMVWDQLLPLVQVAETMAQKYHVTITNPPYMGSSGMSGKLSDHVKKNYPDSKSDLFAVFIEKCGQMICKNGYQAMITQHAWMFLSSFEKLRVNLLAHDIINMIHLGARAFEEISGEVVQTTSFTMRNIRVRGYKGTYCRLVEGAAQDAKEYEFLYGENRYNSDQGMFSAIPSAPYAYWITPAQQRLFENRKVGDIFLSDGQNITGNNETYLRYFWEVRNDSVGRGNNWVLCARGGTYRKWFGNVQEVIDWSNSARNHYKSDKISRIVPEYIRFRKGISWSRIASTNIGFRVLSSEELFEKTGVSIFPRYNSHYEYILALLNSCVTQDLMQLITQVITLQVRDVFSIPVVSNKNYESRINKLVTINIKLAKEDWDSFETSWDFSGDPLVIHKESMWHHTGNMPRSYIMSAAYLDWKNECEDRFQKLKTNEEELNRIFIDIYGLQDELTPDVEDKDVTVYRIFDGKEEIPESMGSSRYALTCQDVVKNFVSYAVGCMFGRYSLDVEGLAFAGGDWDDSKYRTFPADQDNIIPICDDAYFPDDIVGKFVKFVETVYGTETLDENLRFIAEVLGGKGQPREVIRNYFLNDFYKDHCKTYQKRPIYWLFDSGKKNGFKALIYMHRYQPDTIARIRTDYVHEQQGRYRTAIETLERDMNTASTGDRVKLNKRLTKLKDQAAELHSYEEKIHHLADQMLPIDLDDGVKHNYEIFQDVLAKIK